MAETGNPNVRTNFKGKYSITAPDGLDHVCMLTNTNDVVFCDNYTSDSTGLICTLPPELRPNNTLKFPIIVNTAARVMIINTDGTLKTTTTYAGLLHYLEGFSFNISGNYYG